MKTEHKCPICKEAMRYIKGEFRCINCLQKEVLKEYHLPTFTHSHCWDKDGDYGRYRNADGSVEICRVTKKVRK